MREISGLTHRPVQPTGSRRQWTIRALAFGLLLPGNGTVIANAAQHSRAVLSLRDLNEHGYFKNARSTGAPVVTVAPVAVSAPVFWSTL